jgi:hypothetical protein
MVVEVEVATIELGLPIFPRAEVLAALEAPFPTVNVYEAPAENLYPA